MFIALNLQLFAEGGESAAEGQAATGVTETPTQTESVIPSSPEQDRQEAYKKFKTDFRVEYDAEVQSKITDRVKKISQENESLNSKVTALSPLLEMLGSKYGVKADDAEALVKALEDDDSYYEEEAAQRGLSVEQLKEFKRVERENAKFKRAVEEQERRDNEQKVWAEWDKQGNELKAVYPDFDMQKEVENPAFVKLIGSGVDVRTAYEVAHHDKILQGAMQFTAQKASEKVANSVIANSQRPSENGLSSQAAAVQAIDIKNLSREQMAELKRRAAGGERIELTSKL